MHIAQNFGGRNFGRENIGGLVILHSIVKDFSLISHKSSCHEIKLLTKYFIRLFLVSILVLLAV